MARSPTPPDAEPLRPSSGGSPSGRSMDLRDLPRALARRWGLFFLIVLGVVAAVMGVTLLIPPVWESEASVRVRAREQGGLGSGLLAGLEEALPTGISVPGLSDTDVQTEMGVLGSRLIVAAIADPLSLQVELVRPRREFRTNVVEVLEVGVDAPRGVFSFRLQEDGSYRVSSRGTRTAVPLPDVVRVGEPFVLGPMSFRILPAVSGDPPNEIRLRVRPFQRMMEDLREDLKIERENAGSRLVTIRYRHTDPYLARALVNGIADRFLQYSETQNKSDSRREVEILTAQVADQADHLATAEARLQAYQEVERIVAPDEQAVQQIRRIAEIQVARDALQVERTALAQLLAEVSGREPPPGGDTPYRRLAAFPSFITNPAVQEFLQALTELETRRAELGVLRTPENADFRMVDGRIREIEEQLYALATDYLEGLDTQIASAAVSLEGFGADLESIPEVEIEYARRLRERTLQSEVYLGLQARLAQTRVQEEIDDARVRIVDTGVIEDRPAFPRPAISLALSGILGLMMGLFGVVAAESGSPFARSQRDAEEAVGAPVLAGIPRRRRRWARSSARVEIVTLSDPWHAAAESYRGLALFLRSRGSEPGIVLVASPSEGDGRSTVAANLAAALARQGVPTALVDADLRNAALHSLFGIPHQPGWVRAALDGTPADAVVHEVESLHLFPAGDISTHPLEVLSSQRVTAFLDALRSRYRAVVVDSPAMETGHDATALASLADGVILVARSGRTRSESLRWAADEIRRASGRILGVVITEDGRERARRNIRRPRA
ncbi:MAG: hypothetical protein EXR92_03740 [Gemmatimonadetes bacterium]|nr:hypothetical protein [Gemmatimonadota bacterium]